MILQVQGQFLLSQDGNVIIIKAFYLLKHNQYLYEGNLSFASICLSGSTDVVGAIAFFPHRSLKYNQWHMGTLLVFLQHLPLWV